MSAGEKLAMTYEAYLARERETGVRHEFVDGMAYAMAGGTLAHSARRDGGWSATIRPAEPGPRTLQGLLGRRQGACRRAWK